MTRHTPGPWAVWHLANDESTYGDDAGKPIITTADGEKEICGVVQKEADAVLIAAAPELLDLVELVAAENTEFDVLEDKAHALLTKLDPNHCPKCGAHFVTHDGDGGCGEEGGEPIHPVTRGPTNEARAQRVEQAIANYAARVYHPTDDREDHDTVVQDFLTDVFHWAARHGVDPDDVASRALRMHQEEVEAEGEEANVDTAEEG